MSILSYVDTGIDLTYYYIILAQKGEQRYDFSFRASLSNLKATIPSSAAISKKSLSGVKKL